MRQPHVDDVVRLTHDIPELSLHRGEIGVVRSTWLAPLLAYEVEFAPLGQMQTRALLLSEQVELDDDALGRAEEAVFEGGRVGLLF
jgi:uncharacterized protein DUF4926